jgi:hypothetical protein
MGSFPSPLHAVGYSTEMKLEVSLLIFVARTNGYLSNIMRKKGANL